MEFNLTEEQRMWQQTVHEFCAREVKPLAAEMDERQEFNAGAVEKMGPLGLLGLNVPEQYGGTGIDAISAAIAVEELGWADGGTALSVSAHNGLACASAGCPIWQAAQRASVRWPSRSPVGVQI
jgi:alkylation response protein AidB-like acyl-CoA dehydrogenase